MPVRVVEVAVEPLVEVEVLGALVVEEVFVVLGPAVVEEVVELGAPVVVDEVEAVVVLGVVVVEVEVLEEVFVL